MVSNMEYYYKLNPSFYGTHYYFKLTNTPHFRFNILSRVTVTIDELLDWILDLLTTYRSNYK
jgi:hypothetical protein